MTILALSWLVLSTGGIARLGLLGVCFTAPVIVGGLAAGPLLDRFDKRGLLVSDSLVRAVCVASVPLAAALGHVPGFLPFAVAVIYGLLKMVPLAGLPAAIPQLVRSAELETANALESLSFSVSSIAGPAAAGVLVAVLGAPDILLFDAASYLVFAGLTVTIRRPLRPDPLPARPGADRPGTGGPGTGGPGTRGGPTLRLVARDRILVATTAAFMLYNIADGILLLVIAPWLARNQLTGGAAALGVLTATLAAGEIIGAAVAGSAAPARITVRRIGLAQAGAALAFLLILGTPRPVLAGAGFFIIGALTAPMTVWAQSMRMRRIPAALHGRAFALLRTMMQATPPLGAAIAPALLAHGGLAATVLVMTVLAGLPALYLMLAPAVQATAASSPDSCSLAPPVALRGVRAARGPPGLASSAPWKPLRLSPRQDGWEPRCAVCGPLNIVHSEGAHVRSGGPVIKARGLTKRYGSIVAVDKLSFDVRPGTVTGFLGPNGAGKPADR